LSKVFEFKVFSEKFRHVTKLQPEKALFLPYHHRFYGSLLSVYVYTQTVLRFFFFHRDNFLWNGSMFWCLRAELQFFCR